MKAPKISFDAAKMQQILLQHVEKIVLGVVLLTVAYFVYQGVSLPSLDPDKTPDKLTQDAVAVKNEINNPNHWDKIKPIREKYHPVQELVKQGHVANAARPYEFKTPLKIPDYAKAIARNDPRIIAPIHTTVHVIHGPLAMLPKTGDTDEILNTELAAAGGEGQVPRQPIVQQPPSRQPPGPVRQPPSGEGRPPRTKQGRAGILEGQGEMSYQPPPPGYGQPGMPGQAGDRSLPPEAIVGFRTSSEVIAKEAQAVVVMAAVPVEQQYEEFDKAFKEALDYDPIRDIPRYLTFRVERADVTADPTIDPEQATWTPLGTKAAYNETLYWGPSPNEVVDLNYVDPLILTHRVPPFLQREIYAALVHPDIPLARPVDPTTTVALPGDAPPVKVNEDDLIGPAATGPDGQPVPGNPIREGRMMQPPGPGMRQPPGMPRGYGEGMQRGGYGEGMQGVGGPTEVAPAKYRLIRFTDTTVQPKRKYRYRVRVLIEDPNNPYVGDMAPPWDPGRNQPLRKPPIQSITDAVKKRREIKDTERFPFVLESEPSEASEIVELPEVNRYFAGQVTPAKGSSLIAGTPPIYTSQPSVNLLAVTWDTKKAVDVPGEKEVLRGSVLNFQKEVEVIHPSKHVIAPIGEYAFKTNSIVVDFRGGDDMPTIDPKAASEKVAEPSEILIFDGEGKLQLLDETEDVEGFRRYLPPKVVVPEPSTGTTIAPADYPGGGLLDGPPKPVRPNRGPGK